MHAHDAGARRATLGALMLALAIAGCSDNDHATVVRLRLAYEASWGLSRVDVKARDATGQSPIARELEVLVPDEWAGTEVQLELLAWRGEERYAYGSVTLTPRRREEVAGEAPLARLPCGAWCHAGAMQCDAEAVVVCESRADGSCLEWSTPVPCPRDAPYCSFGVCATTCVDECAPGEARCDGPAAARLCGTIGAHPCLRWLPSALCTAGQTCANGTCVSPCRHECAVGETACLGGGVMTCGDLNHDGCREWGPIVPCAPEQSCSHGVCADGCTDECSGPVCDGATLRQCGHYDLSDCLKLSAGTFCGSADPCLEGVCTPDGCTVGPRACTTPPSSTCLDDHTLRTHDPSGVCEDGACTYVSHDRECSSCPDCDACSGVTCDTPPSSCYAAIGTCREGACTYPYADGAECSGPDPCVTEYRCLSGLCHGETRIPCTTPPGPTCADATTLRVYDAAGTCRDGECEYPATLSPCPVVCRANGCSGNACGSGWCPLPVVAGTPAGRKSHVAAWTGTEMIVFGGYDGAYLGDGGRFNPVTNTWATLETTGAPSARSGHSAVWTGEEMVVWGGWYKSNDVVDLLRNGARFNPATNTWRPVSTANAPSARGAHTAVWTGTEMIVWGGEDASGAVQDGGRYRPATDSWATLAATGAPSSRFGHSAVWTGTEMIIWGGEYTQGDQTVKLQDGGRFDPVSGTWRTLDTPGAPSARGGHTAVWTGSEMIVWSFSSGGRFDPAANLWRALDNTGAPEARWEHTAVWTGSEMIVWGGDTLLCGLAGCAQDGGRWMP
jgi:hypothetical protein